MPLHTCKLLRSKMLILSGQFGCPDADLEIFLDVNLDFLSLPQKISNRWAQTRQSGYHGRHTCITWQSFQMFDLIFLVCNFSSWKYKNSPRKHVFVSTELHARLSKLNFTGIYQFDNHTSKNMSVVFHNLKNLVILLCYRFTIIMIK